MMTDTVPSTPLRDLLAEMIARGLRYDDSDHGMAYADVDSVSDTTLDGHFDLRNVADAILSDPRIAVVALPEVEVSEWGVTFWPCKALDLPAFAKVQIEDDGRVFLNGIPNPLRNVEQLPEVAAALLAAARHINNNRGDQS